jgi:hypothetical protein
MTLREILADIHALEEVYCAPKVGHDLGIC